MAIGRKIAGGLAWVGLALVVGVPSADYATGQMSTTGTASVQRASSAPLETAQAEIGDTSEPGRAPAPAAPSVNIPAPAAPVPVEPQEADTAPPPATTLVLPSTRPVALPAAPAAPRKEEAVAAVTDPPPAPVPVPRPRPSTAVAPATPAPAPRHVPFPRPLSERPVAVASKEIYIPPEIARPKPRNQAPTRPAPAVLTPPPAPPPAPVPVWRAEPPSPWADEYEYGYQGRDRLVGPVGRGTLLDELFHAP